MSEGSEVRVLHHPQFDKIDGVKKIFLGCFLFLVVLLGFLWWKFYNKKNEVLNPLSNEKTVIQKENKMKMIGFLPTYMVGKTMEYTNEIDELIFLGIEVDEKGNLIWDYQSNKINNETYLKQKELIWKNGGKNILGIKLFEDEKLDKFINSVDAQDNLIDQMENLIQKEKFDGINVDFEYMGTPTAILSEEIIGFLNKLKQADLGEVSLDVFANTIIKGNQDSLVKIIEEIDYLIVMAYDFHRPGVDYAGSVAPIQSKVGERNIMEVVEKILDLQSRFDVDAKKIIMAYPLYGYEWKTYTKDFESQIKRGWYQMASWARIKEIVDGQTQGFTITSNFDELSMTPWLVFEENGEIHQIYYENGRSLEIKMDLVRQNQFGGVGFWALGYEGEDKKMWQKLDQLFN